jgi:paraquat-inducible protein A
MVSASSHMACPECDIILSQPALSPGQRARCPRCGFLLTTCRADPFGRALSFSVSGLIVLGIALSFPFLTISAGGIENSMTLFQTVSYLADYGAQAIAALVFFFVILAPTLVLIFSSVLAAMLKLGWFPSWMLPITRWGFHLTAWSMVEVFSIGVIVSLVKIAAMARVDLGISFWAYLAFSTLFLLAFSSLDRFTVWSAIERLRSSS